MRSPGYSDGSYDSTDFKYGERTGESHDDGFRPHLGEPPDYDEASVMFTIEYHFGGVFDEALGIYKNGEVRFCDNVDVEIVCMHRIDDDVMNLGVKGFAYYKWTVDGEKFSGLFVLNTDEDCLRMGEAAIQAGHYVHMFIISKTEEEVKAEILDELKELNRVPSFAMLEEIVEDVPKPETRRKKKTKRDIGSIKLIGWKDTKSVESDTCEASALDLATDSAPNEGPGEAPNEASEIAVEDPHEIPTDAPEVVVQPSTKVHNEASNEAPNEVHQPFGDIHRNTFNFDEDEDLIQEEDEEGAVEEDHAEEEANGDSYSHESEYAPEQDNGETDDEHLSDDCPEVKEDELYSLCDLDEEAPHHMFLSFHEQSTREVPKFEVGMLFSTTEQLSKTLKEYAIKMKVNIRQNKRDMRRFYAKCLNCDGWVMQATFNNVHKSWQVHQYKDNHTCPKELSQRNITSAWLASQYKEHYIADPKWSTASFKHQLEKDYCAKTYMMKLYRAKKIAMASIEASEVKQYNKLWEYGHELQRTNTGSRCLIGCDNLIFQKMFVCIGVCKRGFLAGCRPLLCFDGCWLKSRYGGQLLTVVGIDAENYIYPVAFAVVDIESGDNWRWFLNLLKEELVIHNTGRWTLMGDKEKGLISAFEEVFPDAEKRYCVRHLWKNLCTVKTVCCGNELKELLWAATTATYPAQFRRAMDRLQTKDPIAWIWLQNKPPHQWSRAFFKDHAKSDMLLNNHCESFNNWIMEAREKPILSLMESIRTKLIWRMTIRRKKGQKYTTQSSPYALKKLEERKQLTSAVWASEAGAQRSHITACEKYYTVDIGERTCSCRSWQLSGLSCPHATVAILEERKRPEDFIHQWYSVENFRASYEPIVNPMVDMENYESHPQGLAPIQPPVVKARRGRPKTKRSKGPKELETLEGGRQLKGKLKAPKKCTVCGVQEHTKRKCPTKFAGSVSGAPSGPSTQPTSEIPTIAPNIGTQESTRNVPGDTTSRDRSATTSNSRASTTGETRTRLRNRTRSAQDAGASSSEPKRKKSQPPNRKRKMLGQ